MGLRVILSLGTVQRTEQVNVRKALRAVCTNATRYSESVQRYPFKNNVIYFQLCWFFVAAQAFL